MRSRWIVKIADDQAIALQTRHIVDEMNAKGHKIDSIYMSGMSSSPLVLMITRPTLLFLDSHDLASSSLFTCETGCIGSIPSFHFYLFPLLQSRPHSDMPYHHYARYRPYLVHSLQFSH